MNRLTQLELYQRMSDTRFVTSSVLGILMLTASLFVNYSAGSYATRMISNRVDDIILNTFGPYNVDIVFIQGAILLWVFVIGLLIYLPQYIPFLTKSVSLFVVVRSFFIVLTHIAPPDQVYQSTNFFLSKFTFGGDLFFSGHTGGPFLLALIFWEHIHIRNALLASSIIFGVTALLGHKHYSIDVFSAFFITYGIFVIAQYLFTEDYQNTKRAKK